MDIGGRERNSIISLILLVRSIGKDSIVLKSYINTLLEKNSYFIAMNLAQVTYLDSGTLNVLIYCLVLLKKGGNLVLIEPSNMCVMLEVVGLNKLVNFLN